MALRICNRCGTRYADDPNLTCPQCLQADGLVVTDFHMDYMDLPALAEFIATGGSVAAEPEEVDTESTTGASGTGEGGELGPDGDEETEAEEQYDESHPEEPDTLTREDLEQHSRNRLSQMARERDLDPSGTKADLIDRLVTDVPG